MVSYLSIGLLSSLLTLAVLLYFLSGRWSRAVLPAPVIPRSGGVAIALAIAATGLIAVNVPIGSSHTPAAGILPALAGGLLVFLIGWMDDLRPLPPLVKLMGQVAAAATAYALGLRAGFIPDGPLDASFTIFCLVGGANAVNLIDGMDGLAAGIAAIVSGTFFFIARDLGHVDAAVLAAALAGASLAFAWLNLPPARVFMGDSGSNLLGFGLASIPLLMSSGVDGFGNFSSAIVLLAVPIAETATTIVRRVATRRSPLQGDLKHIHHRLLGQGWSQGAVLALFYGTTLALAFVIRFGHSISLPPIGRTLVAWLALGSLLLVSCVYILSTPRRESRSGIKDQSKV